MKNLLENWHAQSLKVSIGVLNALKAKSKLLELAEVGNDKAYRGFYNCGGGCKNECSGSCTGCAIMCTGCAGHNK